MPAFVDIHCHLLPGIDDGASDLAASLAMAEMAAADGIGAVIVTPHQLGNFRRNRGEDVLRQTAELQSRLGAADIPLAVLPGADVRIEEGLVEQILSGDVLTLGNHRRHVLLELPHELYFPLEGLLDALSRQAVVGILSHPERNAGLLRQRELLAPLVERGCLMQITAGSLMGSFGPHCQRLAEWMLSEGLVHFVATDAHGPRSRRPLMRRAYERVCELTDAATGVDLCCDYPARVAAGRDMPAGRRRLAKRPGWRGLFARSKAG